MQTWLFPNQEGLFGTETRNIWAQFGFSRNRFRPSVHERCIFNNLYFAVCSARHVSAFACTSGYFEQAELCHLWAVLLCHNTAAGCRDESAEFGEASITNTFSRNNRWRSVSPCIIKSCSPNVSALACSLAFELFCVENHCVQLPVIVKECGTVAAREHNSNFI